MLAHILICLAQASQAGILVDYATRETTLVRGPEVGVFRQCPESELDCSQIRVCTKRDIPRKDCGRRVLGIIFPDPGCEVNWHSARASAEIEYSTCLSILATERSICEAERTDAEECSTEREEEIRGSIQLEEAILRLQERVDLTMIPNSMAHVMRSLVPEVVSSEVWLAANWRDVVLDLGELGIPTRAIVSTVREQGSFAIGPVLLVENPRASANEWIAGFSVLAAYIQLEPAGFSQVLLYQPDYLIGRAQTALAEYERSND